MGPKRSPFAGADCSSSLASCCVIIDLQYTSCPSDDNSKGQSSDRARSSETSALSPSSDYFFPRDGCLVSLSKLISSAQTSLPISAAVELEGNLPHPTRWLCSFLSPHTASELCHRS